MNSFTSRDRPINPYNVDVCKRIVKEKYEQSLREKFGNYVYTDFQHVYNWNNIYPATPRLRAVAGQIPCASFYYIEFLTKVQEDLIYDIGCGMNFFKGILPNVIGIDGYWDPDIHDVFDDEFVQGHQNFFQVAFSINALHFIPITDFCKQVNNFAKTIKSNGRGYISMNVARLVDHTDAETVQKLFGSTVNPAAVADYIDEQIKTLDLNFLAAENLIELKFDEAIDGNIRLVFQK